MPFAVKHALNNGKKKRRVDMKAVTSGYDCKRGEPPNCSIWKGGSTIYFEFSPNDEYTVYPMVVFFLHGEQDLITLKNRINWEFDEFMRHRK